MKILLFCTLMLLSMSSLIAQINNVSNASIHLKNKEIIEGDAFIYDSKPEGIDVLVDSQKKSEILWDDIEFISNESIIIRVFNFEDKSRMFESIVEGESMSLYKRNVDGVDIFYIEKSGELYELKGGKQTVTIDSKTYKRNNNKYKGTLKLLLEPNDRLGNKAQGVSYNERDFLDLVVSYNEGHVSYINKRAVGTKDRTPSLLVYGQYSNIKNSWYAENNNTPAFWQFGVELYPNKTGRHSFKFGLELGEYTNLDEGWVNKVICLNISYLYDIYRMKNSEFYFGCRLIDIGVEESDGQTNGIVLPRFRTGFGYEYHIGGKINAYIELNNILNVNNIIEDYSIGISYVL